MYLGVNGASRLIQVTVNMTAGCIRKLIAAQQGVMPNGLKLHAGADHLQAKHLTKEWMQHGGLFMTVSIRSYAGANEHHIQDDVM